MSPQFVVQQITSLPPPANLTNSPFDSLLKNSIWKYPCQNEQCTMYYRLEWQVFHFLKSKFYDFNFHCFLGNTRSSCSRMGSLKAQRIAGWAYMYLCTDT